MTVITHHLRWTQSRCGTDPVINNPYRTPYIRHIRRIKTIYVYLTCLSLLTTNDAAVKSMDHRLPFPRCLLLLSPQSRCTKGAAPYSTITCDGGIYYPREDQDHILATTTSRDRQYVDRTTQPDGDDIFQPCIIGEETRETKCLIGQLAGCCRMYSSPFGMRIGLGKLLSVVAWMRAPTFCAIRSAKWQSIWIELEDSI